MARHRQAQAEVEPIAITNGQGEIAGEVTTSSVILQSRLTTGSTLVDGNSRLGRNPGDPESTDPDATITQPFTSTEPTGGFLHVTTVPGAEPTLVFRFFDEHGALLHEVRKVAQGDA